MIFIIFQNRQAFNEIKELSALLGSLLGVGSELEDGRIVCSHSILASDRETLDLPALATFLYSQGALIKLGGINGEDYVIPEEE
jgi:hypothetical protein